MAQMEKPVEPKLVSDTPKGILEDKLSEAAKVVQETAEHILEFSRGAAASTEEGLKEKAVLVEKTLASGIKTSTDLIKKYPLESALVCFGVGCLVGSWLKNRD